LAAGPAAKLVIDAAGLVAFRADDVHAAHLGNLTAFFLHLLLRLDFPNRFLPLLVWHVEPRRILVLEARPGKRLGIAAENEVGAAAGHVGRDGDGADAAGLGDDF